MQSMSRKGNCYNAVMENFFGHLKAQMYHGESFIKLVLVLPLFLDTYIHWYNHERIQQRLKGRLRRNIGTISSTLTA